MKESETTKNTLYQLEEKLNREHWGDIQLFEEEDNRYSIAVGKAILLIKELEQYRAIGTVEELQALKENEERFDRNIKMFNEIGLEIRNKAIDEFAEEIAFGIYESVIWDMLATMSKNGSLSDTSDKIVDYVIETSKKIAEQLKGGATDEG